MTQTSFTEYLTTGLPELTALLVQAQTLAGELGFRDLRLKILDVLDGLLEEVNAIAVKMAPAADLAIIAKIHETHTAQRPVTGNLETHIRSEPGPLGLVRVGLIEELDRIINPRGFGTFWRAQEFGTGVVTPFGEIPSQKDRPLYGIFDPSGTTPDKGMRGLNQGTDLAYVPGGLPPGYGTISVDLPGRHFLEDGALVAGLQYKEQMTAALARWTKRTNELVAEVAAERAQQGITVLIEI